MPLLIVRAEQLNACEEPGAPDDCEESGVDSSVFEVAAAVEGETLEIEVELDALSETAVTLSYQDLGTGSAASGTDYAAISPGTLTFPRLTGGKRSLTIQLTDDTAVEGDETINLRSKRREREAPQRRRQRQSGPDRHYL